MRRFLPIGLLLLLVACGGKDSSPAPSPTPTPTPTPTVGSLSGTIRSLDNVGLQGTVRVLDGPNAGRSATTNGSGEYRIDNLTLGNANVAGGAPGYNEVRDGVDITGARTLSFRLQTTVAWSRSGIGDTVFDMPRTFSRVRIKGSYTKRSSNFIVWIGNNLTVNELVGTAWGQTAFDGTYVTSGGVVQVTNSSGVKWSFVEVR